MKAKARYERWKEELDLVRNEMYWTMLWFEYQKKVWEEQVDNVEEPGHKAYAAKQMDIWQRFQNSAEKDFAGLFSVP